MKQRRKSRGSEDRLARKTTILAAQRSSSVVGGVALGVARSLDRAVRNGILGSPGTGFAERINTLNQ